MTTGASTASNLLRRIIVIGGAGFIGGHFVDRLLSDDVEMVTVFDNFSSGREWHLEAHSDDARLQIVRGNVRDLEALCEAMRGHETVIHLASNPDISRAMVDPSIDFDEGTLLSHHVVESMRITGSRLILYASGSGVYGELGELEATEDYGPLVPVSTYGASKLAGEALISAYCHLFGMWGCAFRFGNIVGARQTHGVGYDFARNLLANPTKLRILGDGMQSKSYVHVSDIIEAVLLAARRSRRPYDVYNVATGDYATVREIADLAVEVVGLERGRTEYEFTGGDRGWKGDVPVVRLNTDKIRQLGWTNRLSSLGALRSSLDSIVADERAGRFS